MGIEIERKFLVNKEVWNAFMKPEGKYYRQGYLLNGKERVVRVRIAGDQAFLTIKGAADGISRLEYEYEIPKADAQEMLDKFKPEGTEKIRYRIPEGSGLVWEVDEFLGDNEGLVIAEIELATEEQLFSRPDWVGQEVTHDERYYNAILAFRPFRG
jgi:CYTH domain-containing protein